MLVMDIVKICVVITHNFNSLHFKYCEYLKSTLQYKYFPTFLRPEVKSHIIHVQLNGVVTSGVSCSQVVLSISDSSTKFPLSSSFNSQLHDSSNLLPYQTLHEAHS